jgi:TonB family protein
MLELKPRPIAAPQSRVASDKSQPRRLVLALVLLLVALVGVVVKDRQFWFGTQPSALDSDAADSALASRTSPKGTSPSAPAPKSISAPAHRASSTAATAAKTQTPAAVTSSEPNPTNAATVTRTVLPPLDVEVVAGDNHRTVRPGSNTTKVEIARPGQAADRFAAATNAAERESLSAEAQQPSYPLLAQHMNVQGSVVLQALIGADGVIQDLHVITGPAILASAAQQAVREWHFKPILQNGQAVETKAKITVNFNIKVADGTGTTLAETRTEGIQILSR